MPFGAKRHQPTQCESLEPYTAYIRSNPRERKLKEVSIFCKHNIRICSSNTPYKLHCTRTAAAAILYMIDTIQRTAWSVLFSSHFCYCFCVYLVWTNVYSAFRTKNSGQSSQQSTIVATKAMMSIQ